MKTNWKFNLRLTLASLVLCAVSLAQSGTATRNAPDKSGVQQKKAITPTRAGEDDLKQLKEAFAAFQQKIKALEQDNAELAEKLEQFQHQAEAAQTEAARTKEDVKAVEARPAIARLQGEVSAVKVAVSATASAVQKSDKRLEELETPLALRFRGVKLTPGGYLQFGQIYRTHNANSDTADSYGSFPLSGSANSKTSEFRVSGRASRFSVKAEGVARKIRMMGYVEIDFLGSTPTSTETQTNGFAPRLRLAFAEAKFGHGWTIAGGQNWSLLQTTHKGVDALSEWTPILLDNSYTPGFTYARQGSFRVVKELSPNRQWLAFAVENPETVANVQCLEVPNDTGQVRTSCTSLILGVAIQGSENTSMVGTGNGFSNAANSSGTLLSSPSNDIAPDLVMKYAIEPGWGHYEIKAIGRVFHDRVYPNYFNGGYTTQGKNRTTEGGGFGFGAILPVVAKKVDVIVQAMAGKGIGRYGSTGGPDVTVNPKGELAPIKGLQAVMGLETHLTPKFDFNFYVGDEYYGRTTYHTSAQKGLFGSTDLSTYVIGYGAPQFIDNVCAENNTSRPALCMTSNQNRNIWAAQSSMWYRLYKGSQGSLQLGASYAYVYRRTWDGALSNSNNVSSATDLYRPLAMENIVMTSFRYYLP